jgi:hypothetical protein
MRRCVGWGVLAHAAVVLAAASPALAQAPKVTGTFTVSGKTTTWKHAYVSKHPSTEGDGTLLVVLLATHPVAAADRTRERLLELANSGPLRAVRVVLRDGFDGLSTTPFHPDASDSGVATRFGAVIDLQAYDDQRLEANIKSRMVGQDWHFNAFVSGRIAQGPPIAPDPEPVMPTTSASSAPTTPTEIKKALGAKGYEWNGEGFFQAVMDDDGEAVQLFVKGGMPPDARDHTGAPVLLRAAGFGKVKALRALLDGGADPNATNGASFPVIDAANGCSTQAGAAEAIAALIEAGADVNAKAGGGGTALMMAQVLKCQEVEAMLKKAGAR